MGNFSRFLDGSEQLSPTETRAFTVGGGAISLGPDRGLIPEPELFDRPEIIDHLSRKTELVHFSQNPAVMS